MQCISTKLTGGCSLDIFRFTGTHPYEDLLERAEALNGIDTITWIERFSEPGEFTLTAKASSGLREKLPLASLISHIDTRDVMIVENHEIETPDEDEEPILRITGRSLESWLEQRCVGSNVAADGGSLEYLPDIVMGFDTPWVQAADLINGHILSGWGGPFIHPEDALLSWVAIHDQQHIGSSTPAERVIRRGNLLTRVQDLAWIDRFGIQVVRPGIDLTYPASTELRIHNGVDRAAYVIFSHAKGDLRKAKYLWSNKEFKNDAYVVSTYNELRVVSTSGEEGYTRRMVMVDASDLDSQFTDLPTGTDRDAILAAMVVRGQDAIRNQSMVQITSTDISASTEYQYRRDYDIGDLVSVQGDYDVASVMRVTEYVEFQDENGESGYPTLSALE